MLTNNEIKNIAKKNKKKTIKKGDNGKKATKNVKKGYKKR